MQKKFGQLCCAECEKVIGHFPLESVPTEALEIYCEDCKKEMEEEGE